MKQEDDKGARAVNDDDLHALVDGQLAPARLPEVLLWLRTHPEDALRVAQWQAQRLELRQLHRGLDIGETPPALLRTVTTTARRRAWPQAAAAVLLLGVGLLGGLVGSRLLPGAGDEAKAPLAAAQPAFARDAVLAHAVYTPEVRHPVEVSATAAADEAHLVQWLTKRLGTPLKAPTLQALGFRLLGGRLLPGPESPRAQFMYEDAGGRRVTLYVTVFEATQLPAETAFRSVREGDVESFYWVEGRQGYAFTATLPPGDAMALAREVYRQLSP
jgi:anti-sigma factor RsiW